MSRRWLVVALVLFGTGLFVRAFPDHPNAMPVAVASTVLIAAPSWLALRRWRGGRSAALLVLVLAGYAYAIETFGVVTGVPYGDFRYGAGLGPLAFGLVPLLLPLAYIPLVLGAVAVGGRAAVAGHRPPIWRRVVVGALVLVACDLVLDPGAVQLGYWHYPSGGRYYGVPASNFAGWLLTGAVAMGIAWWWLGRDGAVGPEASPPRGLISSAFLLMAFWSGIAAWHGLAVPALLGAVTSAALWAAARH